jgi:hypothetical protein
MTGVLKNRLLPLLLAALMIMTCLPLTAFAADEESADLSWEVRDGGLLYITGSGQIEPFTSEDDQPWKEVRESISSVVFDEAADMYVPSLAYWFSGCVNLAFADLPGFIGEIGYHAFFDCRALHDLTLCCANAPSIIQGAFVTNHPLNWETGYDPRLQITVLNAEVMYSLCDYDWMADNNPVHIEVAGASSEPAQMMTAATRGETPIRASAVDTCHYCKVTCAYTLAYEQWTANVHCIRHWCSNCGMDQCGGVNGEAHTFNSNGICTKCGYDNGSGGGGGGNDPDPDPDPVCYHYNTYKSWSGCYWNEYCYDCGAWVDSGSDHDYSYGSWEYYNTSRHRRTATCSRCGDTSYSYGNHSARNVYQPYNETQHEYGRYCSTCGSFIGTTTKQNHTFTYGDWQNYNSTKHRRTRTCSVCGYSDYEYEDHAMIPGPLETATEAQHRRKTTCSCGYSVYVYSEHSYTFGAREDYSDTQHRTEKICECGYIGYEYFNHSYTYGAWESESETQHGRIGACVCGHQDHETAPHGFQYGEWAALNSTEHTREKYCNCGYASTETASHSDRNGDNYCDDCGYLLSHFSVTVPANLTIVLAPDGSVRTATNAVITNNSTGPVKVSAVSVTTANGWTLVPFNTNMANAKVDSKQIGFSINDTVSTRRGNTEELSVGSGWQIERNNSLPLAYDAVVSAVSSPVSEQVLTVVFVLEWVPLQK